MVDDLNTKVPLSTIDVLPPTALIETSPANFQAWYFLSQPELDKYRFDALIRAFIDQKLLGSDPGMSGITRVGRLPFGMNGKKKHKGFKTVVREWHADRRFTTDDLVEKFGLTLKGQNRPMPKLARTESIVELGRIWAATFTWLDKASMIKRPSPDSSGWYEMSCPWRDNHTGRADTGAAIREPTDDNGWTGGFRCHHGHCRDKGWRHLTDWVNDMSIEMLENANESAPDSLETTNDD